MPRKNLNKPLNLFSRSLKLLLLGALPCPALALNICLTVHSLMPPSLMQWDSFHPSPVAQELGLKYSLGSGELSPALAKLREILTTPPSSESDLKTRLEEWRKEFKIPFEFVFPEDFPQLKKDLAAAGLKGHLPGISQDNGFLDIGTYKAAVLAGKWPLFDPHDVINHLPDIVDSGWRERLVRHAKVVMRAREVSLDENGMSPRGGPMSYLGHTVRNSTYETHLYLDAAAKTPKLVMRGAEGLNLIESLVKGESVEMIVGRYSWSPIGGDKPEQWPRFKEYLAARGDQLYRRQTEAMTKIGAGNNEKEFKQKYQKALSKATYWHPRRAGATDATAATRVDKILTNLATNIQKDPFLNGAFNEQNKQVALDLSLDLVEDYLNWSSPQ